MSWLNNGSTDDASGAETTPRAEETRDLPTNQLSLHALRALGIFFIRGAVASLVAFGIVAVGYLFVLVGGGVVGAVVVGIGVVVGIVWQVIVVIAANEELRKSGVK
jgi:hypothetical protein